MHLVWFAMVGCLSLLRTLDQKSPLKLYLPLLFVTVKTSDFIMWYRIVCVFVCVALCGMFVVWGLEQYQVCSVHQATEEVLFCAGRVAHFKCLTEAYESRLEFLIWEVSSLLNEQIAELLLVCPSVTA